MLKRGLIGVALLALCAFAPPDPSSSPQLSPKAQAVFDAWRATYHGAQAKAAAMPPAKTPFDELNRRVGIEQTGRQALRGLPAESWQKVNDAIWAELDAGDADNTAFLKTILPADGWFRISTVGKQASMNAWLIVQHSPDKAFRKHALELIEPLVPLHEIDSSLYALLHDRVMVEDTGAPQTYGSQGHCENGKLAFFPIADATHVDERRKSVGLGPLADYAKQLGIGNAC